jgi:hypothetical protein
MRATASSAVTVLIAAFPALVMATQAADVKNGQRTRYKPEPRDFVVVCTLFKGRAPGSTEATPTEPITYDPRFEIGARVERIALGEPPWRVGDRVTFVIHSPSLLLGSRFVGEQFELTFSPFRPTTKNDKVWFRPETRYLLQWVERAKAKKR